ncbi:MAG: hypothetical protein ACYC3S_00125 [Chloroflexota bacterium]
MRAQAIRGTTAVRGRQGTDAWLSSAGIFLLALALLVAGLLYLRQTSVIATGGYDVLQLEAERTRWEIKNRQLSYQVAELSSLTRVEKVARDQLKMAAPEEPVYLKAR